MLPLITRILIRHIDFGFAIEIYIKLINIKKKEYI